MGSHVTINHVTTREAYELDALVLRNGPALNRTHRELLDLADQLVGNPFTEVWVAGDGHGVIGFVALHLGRKKSDRHTASLRILVDEGFERQGIGTSLIEAALAWADQNDITRISATPYVDESFSGKRLFFMEHGFFYEGLMHSAVKVDGKLVDVEMLSRVR